MLIELLTVAAGPGAINGKPGDQVDVSAKDAKPLLEGGYARKVADDKPKAPDGDGSPDK